MDQSKIMSVSTEAMDQLEPGERPHTLEEYSFDHFRLVSLASANVLNLCGYVSVCVHVCVCVWWWWCVK